LKLRPGECVASDTERPGALLDRRRRGCAGVRPGDPLSGLKSPEAFFEGVGAQFMRACHPEKDRGWGLIERFGFAAVSEDLEVAEGLIGEGGSFVTLNDDANGGSHLAACGASPSARNKGYRKV
jgi:hypothetical protein